MKKILFTSLLLLCINIVSAQFGQENIVKKSKKSSTITAADYDKDGDIDFISATGYDDKIYFYENVGGNYIDGVEITNLADEVSSIISIDIDMDGDSDLVFSSWSRDMVVWCENIGSKNFGPLQIISNQVDGPTSVASSDLDLDGDMDILCSSENDDKITWYENLGGGVFSSQNVLNNLADGASSVYASDLDLDGDFDILSSSENDGKIAWYENLGGGVFGAEQIISLLNVNNERPNSVYAGDLDGDGDFDIVSGSSAGFAGPFGGTISLYENLGLGTFSSQQILHNATGVYASGVIRVLDIDNDSDLDIVYSENREYLENLGGNNFQLGSTLFQKYQSFYFADADADSLLDLFLADETFHLVRWKKNMGSGNFGADFTLNNRTTNKGDDTKMTIADLNSDGRQDLIYINYIEDKIEWYENLGNNQFGYSQLIDSNYIGGYGIATADIDNDIDNDIVAVSLDSSNLVWYRNNGNGQFSNSITVDPTYTGTNLTALEVVDFDGDFDVDIIAANNDSLFYYENLGGGVFSSGQIFNGVVGPILEINTGDVDGDSDIDILIRTGSVTPTATVYLNQGGFNLTTGLNQSATGMTELIDIDGDSDLDIVLTAKISNSVIVFFCENDGLGAFSSQTIYSANFSTATILDIRNPVTSDIDKDGLDDIAFILFATTLTPPNYGLNGALWIANNGNGNFGGLNQIIDFVDPDLDISKEVSASAGTSLLFDDLDGDNDSEMLICFSHNGNVGYYYENKVFEAKQARGKIYIDSNQNGDLDSNETGDNWFKVQSNPSHDYAYTFSNGNYILNFKDTIGFYQVLPNLPQYWAITSDSLLYHVNVDTNFQFVDSLDFGVYPDTLVNNLNPEIIGGFPRCNNITNYWLDIANTGTTLIDGKIQLQLDNDVVYTGSSITPDSTNGQSIYWHFDSLYYFSNTQIEVFVQMPGIASLGNTLVSYLIVDGLDTLGNTVVTEVDSLEEVLICAYDPNDKIATPTGRDSLGYIPQNTQSIEYTIRFQNTGNDTAINITIEDQLDSNLLWQSLTPLTSSDQMLVDVNPKGLTTFTFNNIMLPDSGVDFLGSQGFVKYKIDLKPSLPIGTQIFNTANIYFDANPAVVTNTKIHTIDSTSSVSINDLVNENLDVIIYPNPFNDFTTIEFKEDLKGEYDLYVYDIVGKEIQSELKLQGNKFLISQAKIGKGIYIINIVNNKTGEKVTRKIISQ